jgi:hypothetical protein
MRADPESSEWETLGARGRKSSKAEGEVEAWKLDVREGLPRAEGARSLVRITESCKEEI